MHELWGGDLAPLIFVAFFGMVGVFVYPIAAGLRRRLEDGRDSGDMATLMAEVRRLRDEVASLRAGGGEGDLSARLLELEERVDFTERLLARGGAQEG